MTSVLIPIKTHEYENILDEKIAPFHPLFEFEGSGKDGLDNWTNRSPYPIVSVFFILLT